MFNALKLLRTFAACPHEHHFKGKHDKLYIVGKLSKCRFQKKKYELPSFLNSTKENCKNDSEKDHAAFNQANELIGYHNSADFCEIWPEHSLDVVK